MRTTDLAWKQLNPKIILGSSMLQWCRSDLGLVIGSAFDWADSGGTSKPYNEATAANGPSLTSVDATLRGYPTLSFNGTSQRATSALQLPAPGTTPTLLWMIVKQKAWTLNNNVVSGAGGMVIRQSGSTPNMRIFIGINGDANATGTLNSWFRVAAYINNQTTNYIKVGGTTATGTNAGNQNDTSAVRRIGANAGLTTFTSIDVAEIVYANSDARLADLDTYGTKRYGSALF